MIVQSKQLKELCDTDVHSLSIDYATLRERLLRGEKHVEYTGIPQTPSFVLLSDSVLYSIYTSFSFPVLGIKALKRPPVSIEITPKDVFVVVC